MQDDSIVPEGFRVEEAGKVDPDWVMKPVEKMIANKKKIKPGDVLVIKNKGKEWNTLACLVFRAGRNECEWVIKPVVTVSCYEKMPKEQKRLLPNYSRNLVMTIEDDGIYLREGTGRDGVRCNGTIKWGEYQPRARRALPCLDNRLSFAQKDKMAKTIREELKNASELTTDKKLATLRKCSQLLDFSEIPMGLTIIYAQLYRNVLRERLAKATGIPVQDLYLGGVVR